MIHGRYDKTIIPSQAERLSRAAGEPKQLVWWDCGHVLPPDAVDAAAAWLAGQFGLEMPPAASGEEIRRYVQ